jgi:amidase
LGATLGGEVQTGGSRSLHDYIAPHDSELMRRYKATGLVIVGKTNTPEIGLTPFTEPELFGPTLNPWHVQHSAGGSSGGSGAAVAARFTPLASGGDGGGSIRIPAACCGIFGLKPTRARVPIGPDIAEAWHGFAVEGVLTRSVRDCAAMLDAVSGPDAGAPYYPPPPTRSFLSEVTTAPGKLRIAFTSQPFMGKLVHDDCKKGLAETVRLLQDLGHIVEEAAPQVDSQALINNFFTMLCGDGRADILNTQALTGKKPNWRDFEMSTWALYLLGQTVKASDYVAAVHALQFEARKVGRFFEQYDILLTPVLNQPPIRTGALQISQLERRLLRLIARLDAGWLLSAVNLAPQIAAKTFEYIPYTPLFNISGQPAMSVPLCWNNADLPIGMQFVGRYADEATLFRLAGQLEQAQPWAHKKPPLLLNP